MVTSLIMVIFLFQGSPKSIFHGLMEMMFKDGSINVNSSLKLKVQMTILRSK